MDGRHVVVTGGGRGIGKAVALRLAREGATLSLLARGVDALEQTAAEAGGAFVRGLDIRDGAQVEEAFRAAADANGPVHALVANSGIGGPNEPGEGDRFFDIVETNLVGTYRCVRALQQVLAEGGRRDVVVISSILARIPVPWYTGYSASKAGLLGLVRSLAAELAPDDVQVNAICPGWVATDMAWEGIGLLAEALGISRDEAYERAMSEVPLRRMSEPEDVAGTVAWLLSADARGVTGQAIDQNGGAFMI
ncbi:MAG TPA: SDR family NAD(P)-dependent oxidoreductase [Gaiellaceae bacterium]|nr:SDR family NAD(P)-dependent oxidoreductase [Gaiellaceae bacterium]